MELHDSGSGAFSRRGYAAASPGVAAGAKHCGIPGITKSYLGKTCPGQSFRQEWLPWVFVLTIGRSADFLITEADPAVVDRRLFPPSPRHPVTPSPLAPDP